MCYTRNVLDVVRLVGKKGVFAEESFCTGRGGVVDNLCRGVVEPRGDWSTHFVTGRTVKSPRGKVVIERSEPDGVTRASSEYMTEVDYLLRLNMRRDGEALGCLINSGVGDM